MGKSSRKKRAARSAGFSAAEIAAVTAASKATAGLRNPAVVRDAFIPTPITVGAIAIQPFSIGRFLLLEKIDSPFVRDPALESEKKPASNEETIEAVYAMVQPPETLLELLARGREAFTRAAMIWADCIPMSDLPELGAALSIQFSRAQSTVIGSPASSGEDAGAGAAEKKSSGPAPVISPASLQSPTASGGR